MSSRQYKITQKFQVFYKLYQTFKEDKDKWVSAWEFGGEMYIKELGRWTLMTYKTPANGVKIYFENPNLIERRRMTGNSGSKYFQYRLSRSANPSLIIDPELLAFYYKIKK